MNNEKIKEMTAAQVFTRMRQLIVTRQPILTDIDLSRVKPKVVRETFENGYHYASEGSYPDMTYQENVDQAYREWVDAHKLERGEV